MYRNHCRLLCWNQNFCDLQSVSERQRDEWRSSSNCGRIAAKIVRFSSVNSEIIGRKITRFVHNVAELLPFTNLRLANPLLNAEAKSKGCSWRCLRISPKFNWLPQQRPLGDRQTNIGIIIPTNMPTRPVKYVNIGPGLTEIFGVICRFLSYHDKDVIANSINSGVSGLTVTKIGYDVEKFILLNLLKS